MQRTITRQMSFDLTKLLVTEDWFSDISPQTMRRLLNIVSVTGDLPLPASQRTSFHTNEAAQFQERGRPVLVCWHCRTRDIGFKGVE